MAHHLKTHLLYRSIFDTVYNYVELHCNKIYFTELIDDLIAYKHVKRTKYDDTVAFGMSLLAGTENVKS